MGWRGILTVVLLVAAIISGLSVWNHSMPPESRGPSSGRSGYTLTDFELISLDEKGREAFTLRAPRLERAEDNRAMSMQTPLFLFPDDSNDNTAADKLAKDQDTDYWQMRSQTGWIAPEGKEVRLTGNVRVVGPPAPGQQSTLHTEQLDIFPKTNLASSPLRVTMRSGASMVQSGIGLKMNLDNKQYSLLSDVEFHYDPTP